jgi:hypothetical protein
VAAAGVGGGVRKHGDGKAKLHRNHERGGRVPLAADLCQFGRGRAAAEEDKQGHGYEFGKAASDHGCELGQGGAAAAVEALH